MRAEPDPALETLMLPLADGRLAWPEGGVLFLRARDGWPLHAAPRPGLVAEQSFRPDAQALEASGIALATPDDGRRYPLVMLLPPRQRDESRALELARRNLAPFAPRAALEFRWHDVTAGLPETYDVIVSNPPFHTQGRADRPDIGRRFIAVAAQALRPGGRIWLVANRHLPYESVLDASFGEVRTVAQRDGFKVIEAVKAMPSRPERAPKAFDRTAVRNAHR